MSDKQTPKKPKAHPYISLHPNFHYRFEHLCPSCGVVVKKYDDTNIWPHLINNFCFRCGQALDWGQYDE